MSQLEEIQNEFENFYQQEIDSYFPAGAAHFEAIKYSLLGKGKRLRPLFCLGACELVNGKTEWAKSAAVAIEMVHTYSLVHDDLPAMDDDDFRRGVASCHKVFGDDIAILAGDGLLNESFAYLSNKLPKRQCPDFLTLKMVQTLSAKAGVFGMLWGQVIDLHHGDLNLDKILWIHEMKTAKLFQASLLLGFLCQEKKSVDVTFHKMLENFGKELGILFQLLDDLDDWSNHKKGELNVLQIVDVPKCLSMIEERFVHLWKGLEALTDRPKKETILGLILLKLEKKFNQICESGVNKSDF